MVLLRKILKCLKDGANKETEAAAKDRWHSATQASATTKGGITTQGTPGVKSGGWGPGEAT